MKIGIKPIAWLLALLCLLSCVSALPVAAQDSGSIGLSSGGQNIGIAKKKIVAVMYDNSGSMSNSDQRSGYARYALRMLMALLGENDEMAIIPMNRFSSNSTSSGVANDGVQYPVERRIVDLSNPNREAVVSAVLNDPLLNPINGSTPHTPIGASVQWLAEGGSGSQTNEGLKDSLHLNESNENVEHWLIILTDGAFAGCSTASAAAHTAIEPYIAAYPSLNSIYFGMGSDATNLSGQDINTKYKFNSFRAATASAIVSEMQKITNLLTGRYTLSPDCYSFENNQSSGTTLTIQLSDIGFALKNISVIAQNCGAKLTGYTHNGVKMNSSNACVITSELSGVLNGYSAVLDISPDFLHGTVKLTFDKTVKKSDLSILAEPAFRLENYFEYLDGASWKQITMEEINANLLEGSKIRVGYRVFDQASGDEVDLNNKTLFGTCNGTVTYAGNSYAARYAYGSSVTTQGAEITLKEGNNDLGTAVSIMGGSYIMQQSSPLSISGVVVTGEYFEFGYDPAKPEVAKAVFTAKDTAGKALNINTSAYTWSVKVTDPDGRDFSGVSQNISSNGSVVSVTITADMAKNGDYTVAFRVKSNTSGTERNVTRAMKYDYVAPPKLEIQKTTTPAAFGAGGTASFVYGMTADGAAVTDFANYQLTATVTAPDGTVADVVPKTASNGKITVNAAALVGMFGSYKVELKAVYREGTPQEARVASSDTIRYSYSGSDPAAPKITVQKVGVPATCGTGGQATWQYKVLVNGTQLTKAELTSNFTQSLNATDPKGSAAKVTSTVAADGTISVTLTATGSVYGEYRVVFEVKSKYDANFSYTDETTVKHLPGGGGSGSGGDGGSALTIRKDGFDGTFNSAKKAEWTYQIWLDGKQLTKSDLRDYTWLVTATAPDGSAVTATAVVADDGTMTISLTALDGVVGKYTVNFDIENKYAPEDICEQDTSEVAYAFELEIQENHSDKITTDNLNGKLEYRIYAGGSQLTAAALDGFELSLRVTAADGSELSVIPQIGDSGIITATVPAKARAFGHYDAELTIVAKTDPSVTASAAYTLVYHPASVEIRSALLGELKNGVSSVDMEHTILVEGVQMTVAELNRFGWKLEALAPDGNKADTRIGVESDGRITSSIDVSSSGFGLYQAKLSIHFCGDAEEDAANTGCYYERNDELKFYPVSLELTVTAGNLSFTEYDFTQNQSTAFSFELYADGVPFAFQNGLADMRLVIAGMDVTDLAVADGNILTYVPRADELGNLAVGEHDVSLTVDCKDVPTLKTSVTTKLSMVHTVFEVVSLDLGNKTVDRFDLENPDAALYFQVLRDGLPLSLEEMQAAWESGEIQVKDEKGTFSREFWLPCGNETTVEEIDGHPVIVFRVTRDFIMPIHTFAAMFIGDGDKPIAVTYKEAEGTDAIFFQRSNWWSYVWRSLVILFTVHTILYLLGFLSRKKCKSFPAGTVVHALLGSSNQTPTTFSVYMDINISVTEVIAWHAKRFIPNKNGYLWYNQPAKSGPLNSSFEFDEEGQFSVSFSDSNVYKIDMNSDNSVLGGKIQELIDMLTEDPKSANELDVTVMTSVCKATFKKNQSETAIQVNSHSDAGNYYGAFNEKGQLEEIMFFVPRE